MRSVRAAMAAVGPTPDEVRASLAGDEIIVAPDVVMDRAFTLPQARDDVWPWFVQLGKGRSGWYLPRSVERFIPPRRRALRHVDPALQTLSAGDVIADWGGRDATFDVAQVQPPRALVHRSLRGSTYLSWAITLHEIDARTTRVHLRLRLAPVRRPRRAELAGGVLDLLTIAGLAAGLRERLGPAAHRYAP